MWTVDHPVACPDYDPPSNTDTDNDYAERRCKNLTISELECLYPLCPDIMNPTLSKVDSKKSLAILVEDVLGVRVGTNVSFICNEKCMLKTFYCNQTCRYLEFLCCLDMTFRGPESAYSFQFLNYTCEYNQATTYSTWNWTDPWTNDSYIDMPQCSVFCSSQPPEPIEGKMTRTWNGEQWAGSMAVFKCGPGNKLIILY